MNLTKPLDPTANLQEIQRTEKHARVYHSLPNFRMWAIYRTNYTQLFNNQLQGKIEKPTVQKKRKRLINLSQCVELTWIQNQAHKPLKDDEIYKIFVYLKLIGYLVVFRNY